MDPVVQDFVADTSPFVSGLEAAIGISEQFRDSILKNIQMIEAMHAALDDLPLEHVTNVTLTGEDDVLEGVAEVREYLLGLPEERVLHVGIDTGEMAAAGEAVAHLDEEEVKLAGDTGFLDDQLAELVAHTEATAGGFRELSDAEIDAMNRGAGLQGTFRTLSGAEIGLMNYSAGLEGGFRDLAEAEIGAMNYALGLQGGFRALKQPEIDAMNAALGLDGALRELDDALGDNARDSGAAALGVRALSEAEAASVISAGAAAGAQSGLATVTSDTQKAASATQGFWARWGTVIHWVVAGSMEFLAVAIPGTVALGSGMLAAAEGAGWLYDKMKGVYESTEATSSMLHQTAGNAVGLQGALQAAQTAADPGVYEAFGAILNAAKSSMYSFAGEGLNVVHVIDEFAARADIDLGPGGPIGSQLQQLLGAGVKDLTEFGQILGNLGHFIINVASDMPGLAEVLLSLLDDFTRFLNVLTDPSWWNFHGRLITIAMGLEEAWRWGGVFSNMLGSLVTRIGGVASAIPGAASKLAGFFTGVQSPAAQAAQAFEENEKAIAATGLALGNAEGALAQFKEMSSEARGASIAFTEEENEQYMATMAITRADLDIVKAQALVEAANATLMGSDDALIANQEATEGAAVGLGDALKGVGAFLSGPWGWAAIAAAAGVGILIYALSRVQTAVQHYVSGLEQAVDAAPSFTASLQDIFADLQTLQVKYNAASQAAKLTGYAAIQAGAEVASGFGRGAYVVDVAAQNANTYHQAIATLVSQASEMLGMNTKIDGSYYSLYAVWGLATAAGLNLKTAFNAQGQLTKVAAQQISNLVQGYKEMDQTGTTLANDINAINEQTLQQQTKVQALNQAWDGFLSDVTGGTSSLTTLYTDLTTIGNVTAVAKSKITAFSQGTDGMDLSVKQVATSLKSFGGTSAQVWQNYNSGVTQAEQVTDWLRTAAADGVVTNGQYTDSVKGVVAQLLPYAQYSSTAVSELSALAQEAGGPPTTSYKTLAKWVGNTDTAQKNLNSTVSSATKGMSNLGEVAANLASTLDSAVDNAITTGAINIKGIADATQNFDTDLQHTGGTLNNQTIGALKGLVTQLHDAGEPGQDITSIINQLGQRAGDSGPQIKQLDAEIQHLINTMDGVHDVSATVSVGIVETGVQSAKGVSAMASGGRVPGFGGGDVHPALLEGGETIVPKELTPAVAPLMAAHGVPGFGAGGVAGGWYDDRGYFPGVTSAPAVPAPSGGGGGGGGAQTLHVHLMMDGREIANAVLPDLVGAAGRYGFRNSGKATGLLKPS